MLLLALALATMPRAITTWDADLTGIGAASAYDRPVSVRTELSIDPSGHPMRCDVTASSTVRALDRAACAYLLRSARFTPGRDSSGTPVAAIVRAETSFNQPGSPAGRDTHLDYALQVNSLPGAGTYVADVVLTTAVDGTVAACEVTRSTGIGQLDRLACRQMAAASFAPARDARGQPLAALRRVSFGFTTGAVPQ